MAYAWIEPQGDWLLVGFPYSAELVEGLNKGIPAIHRQWIKRSKQWQVSASATPELLRLFRDHGLEVAWGTPSVAALTRREDDPFEALYLRKGAPIEVVESAYRALALLFHPDRAPESGRSEATTRMTRLNLAVEQIRRAYSGYLHASVKK